MLIAGGRVVCAWGNVAARYNVHSIRKSLLSALIGIHEAAGRIDPRHHFRSECFAMLSASRADNLDPLHRIQICGCHCGSLVLASPHAGKQNEPESAVQGGTRRMDTANHFHDALLRVATSSPPHALKPIAAYCRYCKVESWASVKNTTAP
jgi:hypothetical protein